MKDKSPSTSRADPLIKIMSRREVEGSRFKGNSNPYSNNDDMVKQGLRSSRNSTKGIEDATYGSAAELRVKSSA